MTNTTGFGATLDAAGVIAGELGLGRGQVERTLALFAGGATVPFIARYRKEATGGLDEVRIGQIQERHEYHVQLEARRTTILDSIAAPGKLTDDLRARILATRCKTKLEDLYAFEGPARTLPGHRVLAVFRGEHEGFLKVSLAVDEETALARIRRRVVRERRAALASELDAALVDSWKRLLEPSIEADARG